MKKTVIIAILLIYLGSVVIVNFFGLQVKGFESTKYVTSIECKVTVEREEDTDITVKQDSKDPTKMRYIFHYIENPFSANGNWDELQDNDKLTHPNKVVLTPHVYPNEAHNKKIEFRYDKGWAEGLCIFDEEHYTIYFLDHGTITIDIVATDGSNIVQTISITAKA